MPDLLIARLAWEYFQAQGPKTLERLEDLVLHQADVYNCDDTILETAMAQCTQRYAARYGTDEKGT